MADVIKITQPARGPTLGTATRRIAGSGVANACYFRSGPSPGRRKALLKITDRCDLRCAHCFVSATPDGADMALSSIGLALPRLLAARVESVTITGGEPLVHPDLTAIIELFTSAGLAVTICTNAVQLTDDVIATAARSSNVWFNVSLDGLSAESHGRFRGDPTSFEATLANTRRLAEAGLLKGILSTPNALAEPAEYTRLYELVRELDAEYLLMNPLSSFGRGIRIRGRLQADERAMRGIHTEVSANRSEVDPDAVFIRFPNESEPLSSCIAGDLIYVFVNGDVTVCPYLVFATENSGAQHRREEFVVGNLFADDDFVDRLDRYDFHSRYEVGSNETCVSCRQSDRCGKGCPAAVIAAGGKIGDLDRDVCPEATESS